MSGVAKTEYAKTVRSYRDLHNDDVSSVNARKANYTTLVNQYYDLATDFYEFGWGQSFHFFTRNRGERFKQAIARHERFLADTLGLDSQMCVLDIGCGVGGPMREIARYSGAAVVGINNNAYQIEKGQDALERQRLDSRCRFLKADFMEIPLEDESFDGAYAIEATCHAPDKTELFAEIWRLLKPGAGFVGYEWCLTPGFNASREAHCAIKKGIEEGDGLPDIAYTHEVDQALCTAGFELITAYDLAPRSEVPWWAPLAGSEWSLRSLPRRPVGRELVRRTTALLEKLKIAPQGTSEVSAMLNRAADALVAGGKSGCFTPMYFFHARKPAA
ncbi:MAG: methyltransferase domain-containing protein [Deltaproteobacteria bacterium]|nr:methyltransferase domain-containing protein [Deltaproteobacteria bacterium]